MNKIKFILLFYILYSTHGIGQNFVWNKLVEGNGDQRYFSITQSFDKELIYVVGILDNILNEPLINIIIEADTINTSSLQSTFMIILDKQGNVILLKKLCDDPIKLVNLFVDRDENIYFSISNSDYSFNFLGINYTYTSNIYNSIILKYNKNLTTKMWHWNMPNILLHSSKIHNNNISIIFSLSINQKIIFNNDTFNSNNKFGTYLIMSDTSGNLLNTKFIGNVIAKRKFNRASFFELDFNFIHNKAIFIALESDSIMLNNDTFFYPKVTTIISNFNPYDNKDIFWENLNQYSSYIDVKKNSIQFIDSNNFVISGSFADSIKLLKSTSVLKPKINGIGHFFISLYKNNIPFKVLQLDTVNLYSSTVYSTLATKQFYYFAFEVWGKFETDYFKSDNNDGYYIFAKMDTLGNLLWIFRTGSVPAYNCGGFAIDNDDAVYIGSTFRDSIILGKEKIKCKVNSVDFVISKIFDYEITRGNVSKGPYCAGDTILIPFTKDGNFTDSNQFIAELSDENGNFDGAHRELGRINAKKDSVIKGVLPLFDVVSSGKYRIRIISTSPTVQSYYRYDSLRLLIYSKDTANAGKDTTVCYGAKVPLKTSGGSRWHWSPGYLVEDSTARITTTKALVQGNGSGLSAPDLSTIFRFRIIISDSSGCGKTDTAYKEITVMPQLKISNRLDTLTCPNLPLQINLRAKGGIPLAHQFSYKNIDSTNWNNRNSINFNNQKTTAFDVKLKDGCSLNDSVRLYVNHFNPIKLINFNDTSLCPVETFNYRVKIGNPDNVFITYQWKSLNPNSQFFNDSISIFPIDNDTISLKLTDQCLRSDSSEMVLSVYEKPSFSIEIKDSCYLKEVSVYPLFSNPRGINIFNWTYLNNSFSNDSICLINNPQKSKVYMTLTNSCYGYFEDSIGLKPMPNLSLYSQEFNPCLENNYFVLRNNLLSNDIKNFQWKSLFDVTETNESLNEMKGQFVNSGFNKIYFESQTTKNCLVKDSVIFNVFPSPTIKLDWQKTTREKDFSTWRFRLLEPQNPRQINWDFGNLGSDSGKIIFKTFTQQDSIEVKATVTDNNGCKNDTSFKIGIIHLIQFFIPNIITQNNDGINDNYMIHNPEWITDFSIKIYNRWGNLVYKSNDPLQAWNPDFDGNNVYIYYIFLTDIQGVQHELKGSFDVVR